MKVTTLPKLLLLGTAMSLPVASLAQPPAWAGKGKGQAMQQQESHEREYRRDDHHRDYRDYRYSDRERDALRRHLSNRDYQSLPPGLQKKVARGGQLPPGWQKKLQVGRTLPDDLYYHGQRLPVYDGIRRIDGVTDVIIDNEAVRIMDATQTIIDVFGIR
ncbi:hypothetical protein [Alcanivorax sp.]|uniref:hypothetical protein n=1 Tax=Alcanivorax sp. TaxID=1872427 RepID=UPI0025B83ED0|nr:hypothetical protein [Alcanivorax sp.]